MDNVTFAVVPDPKEGWRVALGERSRKGMTPQRLSSSQQYRRDCGKPTRSSSNRGAGMAPCCCASKPIRSLRSRNAFSSLCTTNKASRRIA